MKKNLGNILFYTGKYGPFVLMLIWFFIWGIFFETKISVYILTIYGSAILLILGNYIKNIGIKISKEKKK